MRNCLNADLHHYWASLFQSIVYDVVIFNRPVINVNDKFPLATAFYCSFLTLLLLRLGRDNSIRLKCCLVYKFLFMMTLTPLFAILKYSYSTQLSSFIKAASSFWFFDILTIYKILAGIFQSLYTSRWSNWYYCLFFTCGDKKHSETWNFERILVELLM